VRATVGMLHTISAWVDETPPLQTPMRYGNPAFRTFVLRLTAAAEQLTSALLPAEHSGAAVELAPYLVRTPHSHSSSLPRCSSTSSDGRRRLNPQALLLAT
jgi:hypothetical protein